MLAPIVLFTYNRPKHVYRMLKSLMKNDLASRSILFIYSDGPKENTPAEGLKKIKNCEKNIDYVFYVNRSFLKEGVEKKIEKINGIKIRESFFENNNLNWIIYEFDKDFCE